jgi:thiamine-phosphate pyrophosphorylase
VPALSRPADSVGGPILCYVTDRRSLPAVAEPVACPSLVRKVGVIAAAGVDWVQIREKDLSAKELAGLTREAVHLTAQPGDSTRRATRIFVNDRVDVALTEGAGGVHLGENSLPVADAKRLVEARSSRKDFLVGVSCHSLEAAKLAANDGADYLFFGPIFDTPAKAAFGAPQGLERLTEICNSVSVPVLAIGGITLENAAACVAAGAAGIAAIRLFHESIDLTAVVGALRRNVSRPSE